MRSTVRERGDATLWDITRPARPSRVAGVSMAGFRDRGVTAVGQRVVPHPAVTLALEFGSGPLIVDDAAGRQQRGSLVAGLGFGSDALWVRGENFEAVQVRLSPVIARAILGVSPGDLNGAVVTLDDVWGRQASHVREQLCNASSWEDRFALVDALLADQWQAGSRTAGPVVDPEVAWAWKRILVSRGQARVDRLAAEVGWSRKRLWYRAARAVLDIGLHLRLPVPSGGGASWTPDAALQLLRDRCHQGPYASVELARYLGRPGQALTYKVGERVWLAGRSSFPGDRRAFHRRALELGSLGLDQLTGALTG